jgi:rRNA biogenesis protein RRP5
MASLKRTSNAAGLPSAKPPTKRRRTDTQPAHPETSDHKSAGKQSKPGKDSSKSTRTAPTSLLMNEQPAFPRGGASLLTPIEKKQIQAQANRDALKEHASSGGLFTASGQVPDGSDGESVTQDTQKASKKRRRKASKQKTTDKSLQENKALRIEGLSYKVSMLLFKSTLILTFHKEDCTWIPGSGSDHEHQLPGHYCCSSKQFDWLRSFDSDLQSIHS